jgi:hypothetical protein
MRRCFLVSSEDAWVILKQTKMLQNIINQKIVKRFIHFRKLLNTILT